MTRSPTGFNSVVQARRPAGGLSASLAAGTRGLPSLSAGATAADISMRSTTSALLPRYTRNRLINSRCSGASGSSACACAAVAGASVIRTAPPRSTTRRPSTWPRPSPSAAAAVCLDEPTRAQGRPLVEANPHREALVDLHARAGHRERDDACQPFRRARALRKQAQQSQHTRRRQSRARRLVTETEARETRQVARHGVDAAALEPHRIPVFAPRTIEERRDPVIEDVEEGHHCLVTLASQDDVVDQVRRHRRVDAVQAEKRGAHRRRPIRVFAIEFDSRDFGARKPHLWMRAESHRVAGGGVACAWNGAIAPGFGRQVFEQLAQLEEIYPRRAREHDARKRRQTGQAMRHVGHLHSGDLPA